MAELRETIEPKFARLAAERATTLTADISFHMLLPQASQNLLMVAPTSLANQWTTSVRPLSPALPGRLSYTAIS